MALDTLFRKVIYLELDSPTFEGKSEPTDQVSN